MIYAVLFTSRLCTHIGCSWHRPPVCTSWHLDTWCQKFRWLKLTCVVTRKSAICWLYTKTNKSNSVLIVELITINNLACNQRRVTESRPVSTQRNACNARSARNISVTHRNQAVAVTHRNQAVASRVTDLKISQFLLKNTGMQHKSNSIVYFQKIMMTLWVEFNGF